ncbi:phosphodiesterase [Metaclostridioides mangenotii]|uniref:phosphodiesterase n=1 Tax=Metaclostridioides mangenotii TaxID=1540 RepID=UPI0004894D40|nr:phosphodiesterase [Clostridioides mangenotii]
MKIGVISDTHGSLTYFDKAMKALSDCDMLFHGGDILYHGPRNDLPEGYNPKPMIKKLNALKNIVIVKGNCEADVDQMVLKHPIQNPYAVCQINKTRFILNHGYTEPKETIIEKAKNMGADVLILGHTHIKELTDLGDIIVLNPGSTSIPKDGSNSVATIEVLEGSDKTKNKLDINFIDINTMKAIKSI